MTNKKQYTITLDPVMWHWNVMQFKVFLEQEISWYNIYTTDEDENVSIKIQVNMPEESITAEDLMACPENPDFKRKQVSGDVPNLGKLTKNMIKENDIDWGIDDKEDGNGSK